MNSEQSVSPDCLSDDVIDRLLNDDLEPSIVDSVELHLGSCDSCAARMDRISIRNVSVSMRPLFDSIPVPLPTRHGPDTLVKSSNDTVDSATEKGAWSEASDHKCELPQVSGYQLVDEIGRGGMGVVYRAKQLGLNRDVALKMISEGLEAGPERIARFYREAETLAQVSHPNVIRIFDIGERRGRPFFAMELIPGKNLAEVLDGTPWPNEKAAELVRCVADAVHAVHEAGIVHRDLKPSNVLLNGDANTTDFARLRVTDFGLAKSNFQSELTQTGQALGTPAYLSPEQATGQTDQVSPATDVYALGCILYELLTGRPPLVSATLPETLRLIAEKDPVSPLSLNPVVAKDLATICLQCLQKEPERRYPTSHALAEDLNRFLAHEPIKARPVSVFEWAWKLARKRPGMAVAILVSMIAMTALLIVWIVFTNQLSHSKTVAESNEKLAKANFNRAHQAARKYLNSSIQHTPEGSSQNLLFQKQLMENGISFYEALIVPDHEIPEKEKLQQLTIRNELAQLLFEYSKVLRISEDTHSALDALDRTIDICKSAQRVSGGSDSESRKIRASALVSKARVLATQEDEAANALASFEQALECFEKIEQERELNEDYLNWYRSVIFQSRSDLYLELAEMSKALANIQSARKHSSEMSKFVPDFQLTHSKVCLAESRIRRKMNQLVAATECSDKALRVISEVCENSSPARIVYEQQRIDCFAEQAKLRQLLGQNDEATDLLDRAIAFQENLIAMHTENEQLLIEAIVLLQIRSEWASDSKNKLKLDEKISRLNEKLNNISDDPDKMLINVKMQMQAASREAYRYNPGQAIKYFLNSMKLLERMPADYKPELQSELRSGLKNRLAKQYLDLNDYRSARQFSAECMALDGNPSDELKSILAIALAMLGDNKQAQNISDQINWSEESMSVYLGRKLLVDLVDAFDSQERIAINETLEKFKTLYADNLKRGNGNQFLKRDLCRAVDWLAMQQVANRQQADFISWAKETAIQILIDETIPKYSDGARSLANDARFTCLRGIPEFEQLLVSLNSH